MNVPVKYSKAIHAQAINPSSVGWLINQLNTEQINYLWKVIEDGEKESVNYKPNLAGNISRSEKLVDKDDYFFKTVLEPHVQLYYETWNGHPVRDHAVVEGGQLKLTDFWVNYQYQHEFNPYHHHGGVYSFVIWMKIPTQWEEQHSLPLYDDTRTQDRKASNFEFEYLDILGRITNFAYQLCPKSENTMLFFPSALRHTVYPFYNCKDPRISISGNLWLASKEGEK
jgi:hypothetical protein